MRAKVPAMSWRPTQGCACLRPHAAGRSSSIHPAALTGIKRGKKMHKYDWNILNDSTHDLRGSQTVIGYMSCSETKSHKKMVGQTVTINK